MTPERYLDKSPDSDGECIKYACAKLPATLYVSLTFETSENSGIYVYSNIAVLLETDIIEILRMLDIQNVP